MGPYKKPRPTLARLCDNRASSLAVGVLPLCLASLDGRTPSSAVAGEVYPLSVSILN